MNSAGQRGPGWGEASVSMQTGALCLLLGCWPRPTSLEMDTCSLWTAPAFRGQCMQPGRHGADTPLGLGTPRAEGRGIQPPPRVVVSSDSMALSRWALRPTGCAASVRCGEESDHLPHDITVARGRPHTGSTPDASPALPWEAAPRRCCWLLLSLVQTQPTAGVHHGPRTEQVLKDCSWGGEEKGRRVGLCG